MHYQQNSRVAAAYIITSGLMFACMGACIKLVSQDVDTEWVVFCRNFFGLVLLIPLISRFGLDNLKTKIFRWHLARSVMGLSAMYCFFYAIAHISLADAVLLSYTTPLFAPIIAVFLLGEAVTIRLGFALLVGFAGVYFIINPELAGSSWISLVALLSGFLAAIAMTCIRRLARTEPTTRIVFYYSIICATLSVIPLIHAKPLPNLYCLVVLAVIGALAILGQLSLTQGYAKASVAQVGPFTYSSVLFATLLGWLFWQEAPDILAAFGIILVIAAGSVALTQSGKQRVEQDDLVIKD